MDMVAQLKMTFDYKKPWKDLASLPISLLIWNIMQNHGTWNSRPKKENFLLSSFTFARNWFWLRFFSFQLQQAAVGAAATTMAECERQFERLLTRGTYSLLRYRYRWMGDIITWKLWTLQKRGGGEHTHVWVITVPSERINSGDPRQFTNAGRGEASIAIHTHTHTHVAYTHAIVIRYTWKDEEEEEIFFYRQLCDGSGPSKATGSSSCFSF